MIGDYRPHHPDECLFSGCARCFELLPYEDKKQFLEILFNDRNIMAVVDLPSHIKEFVSNLPEGHYLTVDHVINQATLLPYYYPFLPRDRYETIRNDMEGRNGKSIHMRIGEMATSIHKLEYLRYCPECVIQDRKLYRETYWHRLHQVPGVLICPIHHVYIEDSSVPLRNRKLRYEFISAESANLTIDPKSAVDHLQYSILLKIAQESEFLLETTSQPMDFSQLRKYYLSDLFSLGYASFTGRLHIEELIHDFEKTMSMDLLDRLGCCVGDAMENWLLRLLRDENTVHHPLRHLLILAFIGKPISSIFENRYVSNPFGNGPWPCLNPVCSDFLKPSIGNYQIRKSSYTQGRPIALFSCHCGYEYEITAPNSDLSSYISLRKVVSFGSLWESELEKLWENHSVSLRKMADLLDVDPTTVKRHASRLGLSYPRAKSSNETLGNTYILKGKLKKHEIGSTQRDDYRETWLKMVEGNPELSNKKLRELLPGVYTWLYRNDRDWLFQHGSCLKAQRTIHQRVDWENRDEVLSVLIITTASLMKQQPGKPVHLSRTAIARQTGHYSVIEQHPDKLPKTIRALDASVETREEYAVRRIIWAYKMFSEEGIGLDRWKVIKRAGVERLYKEGLVADALNNLNL